MTRAQKKTSLIVSLAISLLRAPLWAQERTLTLEQVLALARERAPTVVAARIRIEEAEARLHTASLRQNPVLEAETEPAPKGTEPADFNVGLTQDLAAFGRRRARLAAAQAGIDRAQAESSNTTREFLGTVAAGFFAALHARERLRLETDAEAIAKRIADAAGRRLEGGDIAALEANVARTTLARGTARRILAKAFERKALAELQGLLGLPVEEPVAVVGGLEPRAVADLDHLLESVRTRPDVRIFEAEAEEAHADLRLARTLKWPDLGVGARYERQEGRTSALATLRVTLPVANRGQGLAAEASARVRRLELEGEAQARAAQTQVRSSVQAYAAKVEALQELTQTALPLLEENESLAAQSYEVGQIGLAEFLLVRREILDTRNEYLDRLLEVALARVELEMSAGVLR